MASLRPFDTLLHMIERQRDSKRERERDHIERGWEQGKLRVTQEEKLHDLMMKT